MVNFNSEDLASHYGIAAIIKNEKGEILMQEHVKYGFWTIPVGKVKSGQRIEEALKEEILEECNLVIEDYKGITTREYAYNRNGNPVIVKAHLFEILRYSGIMRNNEVHKHRQQLFIGVEKVRKLPHLSDLTLLYLETLGVRWEGRI